ncbi:MAG: Fur family transcriptional regulator [Candidatus Cloacimonas sp.]|jgi:Fur family ferric uptake transcriptional regulator|nr:Fur family transcriptional regulator [Candidatus Cloacimonas sp.]
MKDYEERFDEFLAKKGLKLTAPRKHILEVVFAIHEHFNAEELYSRIKGVTKGISLATVYRTIPLLLEAGLVQHAVLSSGGQRFEHIYGHPKHIHWLCSKCGTIQESDLKNLMPAIEEQAKALCFNAEDVQLSIKGLCWKCSSLANENQIDDK